MHVNVRCEVLHLFTPYISAAGRSALAGAAARQGVIPDNRDDARRRDAAV
jgi:hypothetical protein